jgi:hypothetical protein
VEVNEMIFDPGASQFQIAALPGVVLKMGGVGVTNNSGVSQEYSAVTTADSNSVGRIVFTGSASAGTHSRFSVGAGLRQSAAGASVEFEDETSAGSANFVVAGGTAPFPMADSFLSAVILRLRRQSSG